MLPSSARGVNVSGVRVGELTWIMPDPSPEKPASFETLQVNAAGPDAVPQSTARRSCLPRSPSRR
jgi:hypothetical protein